MRQLFLLAIILFIPTDLFAHPVSFKDGYGIMPSYMNNRRETELNYSYSHSSAVGINYMYMKYKDQDIQFVLPQFNHKFYRNNELGSQTNIYGSFGAGYSDYANRDNLAGMLAFQADHETRRVYTLLSGEHLQTDGANTERIRYRAGFAPYLANYEDLNTWIIAQVDYTPQMENEFTVTPMIRLFYQNYLIEAGVSLRGDPFFAGIFHF